MPYVYALSGDRVTPRSLHITEPRNVHSVRDGEARTDSGVLLTFY